MNRRECLVLLLGVVAAMSSFAASICLQTDAKPWERTAAEELETFLGQVAAEGQVTIGGQNDVVFHVGATDFAKAKGLGPESFADEEWCVKSFGRDVVLTGGGRRGALYAVYHFLEDDCDVRFWADETEIPAARPLSFSALDRRGRPFFRRRVIFRDQKGCERQAVRCRVNGNGDQMIPTELGGEGCVFGGPYHTHTWDRYLPFAKYGKEHPEWYSLVKGERIGGQHRAQLCLTCPGLVDVFAAEVEKWIARDRANAAERNTDVPLLYCLSANDNHGYCECAACRAEIERYGMSGYQLRFQNAVAAKVGAHYPDVRFTVSAYHETEDLPKGGVAPSSSMIVKICNTTGNLVTSPRDPENHVTAGLIRDWGRLAGLNIHEYGITFGFQYRGRPLPSEFSIVDRYRFYAEHGVSGGLVELEYPACADMYVLKHYLLRRALEDPQVDSEALIGEFMRRYYGPAGEGVLAARRRLLSACRVGGGFVKYAPKLHDFDWCDDAVLAETTRLFDAAERQVAGDAKRLSRVKDARASLDRMADFRKRMARLAPPEPGVSDVPFLDFPVDREMWCAYPRSDIRFIEDPAAKNGRAIGVTVTPKNRKSMSLPFECGFSADDGKLKRRVVIDRPVGDGYQWYDLGEIVAPDREVLVWMTKSWTMQFKLRAPKFDGKRLRVKLHLKFEGPEFFPGATGESILSADRIVFCPSGDVPKLSVDCAFPGGNVKVCCIDEAAGTVSLDTDSRGDSDWFWSYFRVSGAAGRKIDFTFSSADGRRKRISRMGMLYSLDEGKSWEWTAPAGDQTNAFAFSFDFPATAKRVRFATSYPYTKADLDAFVASVPAGAPFRREALTTSRKGRSVDLLRLGDDPQAEWSLVLSARHHACESPASFVLEGILQEALAPTPAGEWLRRHMRAVVVPFMDTDGVEDGDQGKGRLPHDHNRDYVKEIYPEVRAFKRLVREEAAARKIVSFDLHAPTVRGTDESPRHDNVFTLGPSGEQAPRWDAYRARLVELTKDEPIRYLAKWDEPWMVDYNVPPKDPTLLQSRLWMLSVPNVYVSSCWEIPYGGRCGGVFTSEAARRFGRAMARALVAELQGK